jgi:hypothetical protein
MTKTELQVIRNIIRRLQSQNLGCSNSPAHDALVAQANAAGLEVASRHYLDSWVVPALELLLPDGEVESMRHDPKLAASLSGR